MSDIERLESGLLWYPRKGFGFYPVMSGNPYDSGYFEKYRGYAGTPRGQALTKARVDLVQKHIGRELVVDIGIGCGHFIESRGSDVTRGYDVNPEAIRWLLERGLWADPYFQDPANASCFDSLEHMSRPEHFVERVRSFLFLSIPIFDGPAHVSRSKHFRTDEHYFYFTKPGLISWMADLGFGLVDENSMEQDLGREDIGTFVFKRKNSP